MATPKSQLMIHLPYDLHRRLKEFSFEKNTPMSTVMVKLIEALLEGRLSIKPK